MGWGEQWTQDGTIWKSDVSEVSSGASSQELRKLQGKIAKLTQGPWKQLGHVRRQGGCKWLDTPYGKSAPRCNMKKNLMVKLGKNWGGSSNRDKWGAPRLSRYLKKIVSEYGMDNGLVLGLNCFLLGGVRKPQRKKRSREQGVLRGLWNERNKKVGKKQRNRNQPNGSRNT